jgi:hypothetical protein
MPARHRTDRLPGVALGNDRLLDLARPLPPLAGTREDFEPLDSTGGSIIT